MNIFELKQTSRERESKTQKKPSEFVLVLPRGSAQTSVDYCYQMVINKKGQKQKSL